jgi:hypothetical protein
MARIKFVQQWVDKRDGGAVARYYFRRRGSKLIALPGCLDRISSLPRMRRRSPVTPSALLALVASRLAVSMPWSWRGSRRQNFSG